MQPRSGGPIGRKRHEDMNQYISLILQISKSILQGNSWFQEFMILPVGALSFKEAMIIGADAR